MLPAFLKQVPQVHVKSILMIDVESGDETTGLYFAEDT